MATSTGQIAFTGASGQRYIKDVYVPDTANALFTWDAGAGASATSPDYVQFPEAVRIDKYYQVAATGQTRTALTKNGVLTGNMWRNSLHIPSATIIGVPDLGIWIEKDVRIGLMAIA